MTSVGSEFEWLNLKNQNSESPFWFQKQPRKQWPDDFHKINIITKLFFSFLFMFFYIEN